MENSLMDFVLHHIDKISLVVLIFAFTMWEAAKPARGGGFKIELIDIIAAVNVTFWGLAIKALLTPSADWLLHAPLASWHPALKIFSTIVIADFLLYWVHVALHKDLLWKTHRFHHAVTEMNWLKGVHTSATHIAAYVVPQVLVGSYLFGLGAIETSSLVALSYFIQFWQHANVTVDIGVLSYVFVTPQSHRVHHSLNYTRDSNFGAIFSVWDHLFGTFQWPADESYPLGVKERVPLVRGLLGI